MKLVPFHIVYYKNVVFFLIKLAAVQASGGAHMKLHEIKKRTAE
jgi:hypothetical protein